MNWSATNAVVLDAAGDQVAVWAVTTGPLGLRQESRLAGAWLVPTAQVGQLHVWQPNVEILVTTRGESAIPFEYRSQNSYLAPQQLVQALQSWIRSLDAAFAAEQASRPRSKQLEPPRWPRPDLMTLANLSPSEAHDPASVALTNARWLAQFCEMWASVEEQRDMRPFLRHVAPDKVESRLHHHMTTVPDAVRE